MPCDPATPDKTVLRATMRRSRIALARAFPDAAGRAAAALPLDRLPPFTIVGGYVALGGELDPAPVIARLTAPRLTARGVRFALPVAANRAAPLVFRAADTPRALQPDVFGVPAPPTSAPPLIPDLIIAPVLAFDRHGGRLGQGAGCYDRTLADLRAAGSVFVIGLAYAGQEVENVPVDGHDQTLDAILTESGYIEVRKDHRCA